MMNINVRYTEYFNFLFLPMTIPTLKRITLTEPILISINKRIFNLNISIIFHDTNDITSI